MTEDRRPRRPAPFTPRQLDSFESRLDPAQVSEVAHETAAVLVRTGRAAHDPELTRRLVNLVDELGMSTIAELWSSLPAVSLPGALWRLYVLREWVRRDPAGAVADYQSGRPYLDVSHAVAGAADPPSPEGLRDMGDAILTGAFEGDFAVALERAAAFCDVISVGRAHRADASDGHADQTASAQTFSAAALATTASDLRRCASSWRANTLV
ncbi:hypothetical protein G9U51_06830 [Calidifontibacter sp. DB0510]|uniref:Uncharacterized protein n=1 Tax=Metallococcus carri TaxID=1656884 RepID=A0A967AZZ6_9MICO|nr:hypothetical protein [Metallococcus carri]NHN55494.1 hypothetical protein [Metallococcus carri]NOP38322.1 hypothetical protein [Calidifontibacter sp. DB2511S]